MIPHHGARLVTIALVASLALVGSYLALGGASYAPTPVADPCEPRQIAAPEGIGETLQQLALSALDGAACELRIPREDLVAALADPEERARFLDEREISDATLERAVRGALDRAYEDAVRVGAIDGLEQFAIAQAIERVPIALLVDVAQSETGQEAAALLGELAAGAEAEEAIDALEGLLD